MANFMDAIRKTLSENVTEVPDQTEESTVDVTELAVSNEPINELSKKTLGSYIGKALDKHGEAQSLAGYKIGTEGLPAFRRDADAYNKNINDRSNTRRGIKTAVKKLTGSAKVNAKEEVEEMNDLDLSVFTEEELVDFVRLVELDESGAQLDELSREKLGQYVGRAVSDVRNSNLAVGRGEQARWSGTDPKSYAYTDYNGKSVTHGERDSLNLKTAAKREKGVRLAVQKLSGAADQGTRKHAKVNAKEEVITKKETNMNEAAVDTLKPGAMAISDPMSKFEVIRAAIGAMHAMSTDELVKLYNASIAQIGHEADSVPNNAASNRASVAMKPSAAREDVEKMFDGQDLSEEFKSTATTLFEAAVIARAEEEIKNLRSLYEETYTKQVEEIVEDLSGQVDEVVSNLTEQLDKYIDYAVESWMEDNQVAIESTLRSELTEEFIKDLRNLFVEHNISIPEESVEVVEELAARVEELESMLNDQIDENINIKNALIEAEIESMVEEAMHGMTLADQEKFRTMIEAVEFSGDLDDLSEKLQLIKKTYFTEQKKVHSSNIVDETFESETSKTVVTDPNIARYVSAIERTTRSKI